MSKLSSDTLFHFTTWDNLISILENGFLPHFSLERFRFQKSKSVEMAFPMVSFCDIPLSQIRLHVTRYGSYGLGLTKQWGIAKGMNPVLYLKDYSTLSLNMANSFGILQLLGPLITKSGEDIAEVQKQYLSMKSKSQLSDDKLGPIEQMAINTIGKDLDNMRNALGALTTILKHIKQYEGNAPRKGERESRKARFYDEREWRYVPNLKTCEEELQRLGIAEGLMGKKAFDNHAIRGKANALLETVRLSFVPSCIRYIIVKKEDEILDMITRLEQIKGNNYPSNVIKVLTSRILTYEQIDNDF